MFTHRTIYASLTALCFTVGVCQADLVWTGAADNDAFNELNWNQNGGGAPAAGTLEPFVSILENVSVTGATVNEPGGGFLQFSMGDGFALTLDNVVWTTPSSEGWAGTNDTLDVISNFNLINGTDATIQFVSVGAHVNVDAASILRIKGGGDGINSQTEPTQINLATGGRLALPSLAEFTEQGTEIFINGVSFDSNPSLLTFAGAIGTAVPEPSTATLLALSGLVAMLLRRRT